MLNTPTSGSLQVVLDKAMNHSLTKYNIVMWCYHKILVNVAAYVIPGWACVCVCVCVCVVRSKQEPEGNTEICRTNFI